MLFQGSAVALVTPMLEDTQVDFEALHNLVEWHISAGTQAFVVNGTTGEAVTLSWDEQCEVLRRVVNQVNRRIPVIAGTGSNATAKAISQTKAAEHLGADGCLVVTPYYNKPTQEGLYQHFKSIAQSTNLPILLYNVPSRTACDLKPETVLKLAKIPNIVGIKEATGDVHRVEILRSESRRDFGLYSGDDATALDFIISGGNGVISVTANIVPTLIRQLCAYALSGDVNQARLLEEKVQKLNHVLFIEANPIPVKWLLSYMGKIKAGIRLPLTPLSEQYHQYLTQAFEEAGVINA